MYGCTWAWPPFSSSSLLSTSCTHWWISSYWFIFIREYTAPLLTFNTQLDFYKSSAIFLILLLIIFFPLLLLQFVSFFEKRERAFQSYCFVFMQSLFINFASRIEQLLCNHWLQDIFCTSALLLARIIKFWNERGFFFDAKNKFRYFHLILLLLFFIWKNFFLANQVQYLHQKLHTVIAKCRLRKLYTLRWWLRTRSTYRKKIFIRCTGRTYRIGRMILMRAYRLRIRDSYSHQNENCFVAKMFR